MLQCRFYKKQIKELHTTWQWKNIINKITIEWKNTRIVWERDLAMLFELIFYKIFINCIIISFAGAWTYMNELQWLCRFQFNIPNHKSMYDCKVELNNLLAIWSIFLNICRDKWNLCWFYGSSFHATLVLSFFESVTTILLVYLGWNVD